MTTLLGNRLVHLRIPAFEVFLLVAGVALLNVIFHYYCFIAKKKNFSAQSRLADTITYSQLAIDMVAITLLFHFTGAVASPLLFYFLFHIILTSVLLPIRVCFYYITLIAFSINGLALLELWGFLPHIYGSSFISRDVQNNPFFVLMLLLFFNAVLYISSFFVTSLLKGWKERIAQLMKLQKKLKQTNWQLKTLNQLARETTYTLKLDSRLNSICQSIMDIAGVKGVAIRLFDERTNRLELAASCGLSQNYISKGPVNADRSLAKALEGKPHFVLDASTDPTIQYPEDARKEGIISMLALPLKGIEKIIGTLRIYTRERRSFGPDEVDFLSVLANQGAISIENAKIHDALERLDAAKSEFIMLMTHELKGPLAAIQSLLEVLLKGYVGTMTDAQQKLIIRMDKRIESVLEVSTGLMDVYQWQTRSSDSKCVAVPLKKVIHDSMELVKISAQEKGLRINVDLPDEDIVLMGTEEELENILNNLITNAIKYTPKGGNIFLDLSVSQNRVILQINNTGTVIAAEDIPKIFDKFYRTREAKAIDPYGKGLGLPFVKKLVEALGGTIEVKSVKGKGTTFILTFLQR